MHGSDLNCREGTNLVVICDFVVILKANNIPCPYSFHATNQSEVPQQVQDMSLGGLYTLDTQTMKRTGMSLSSKTVPMEPAQSPPVPVGELKDIDAADLGISQDTGKPNNVELTDTINMDTTAPFCNWT